jgi:hypothetical protein
VLATTRIVDSDHFNSPRWRVGGISHDVYSNSHWSFTLHDDVTGIGYVGRVGYRGRVTEGPLLRVDGPPWARTVPAAITFDMDAGRWVLAWGKSGDLRGNHFVYRTPAPVQLIGAACRQSRIEWLDGYHSQAPQQQIGSEETAVVVAGIPSTSLSVLAVGLRRASVPLPIPPFGSGCNRYVDILATSDLHVGGISAHPVPLPEGLIPTTLLFQGFYLDPAVNRFYSTQLLSVPITK